MLYCVFTAAFASVETSSKLQSGFADSLKKREDTYGFIASTAIMTTAPFPWSWAVPLDGMKERFQKCIPF